MIYKIPHPELPPVDVKKSVFINCPYDSEYEIFSDAIFFTIVACGFIPRSAKESGKDTVSRMERIVHALYTSNYSIHDLSRYCGSGEDQLARFNMPFELGLASSKRILGKKNPLHDYLILVPEGAPYSQFISNLAGYDIPAYGNSVDAMIRRVLGWLLTKQGAYNWPSPVPVVEKFNDYLNSKKELQKVWGTEVSWQKLMKAAEENIPALC